MGQRPDGEAQQPAERRVFEVTLKDGTVVRRRPDLPQSRWSDPPLLNVTCQRCGRETIPWATKTEICDPCVPRTWQKGPLNDRAKLPFAKVEDEVSFVEAVTRFSGSSASSAGPASVQKDDRGNSCSAVQHWHLSHSGRKTGRNRISAAHQLTTILVNSPSWWEAGGKRRFVQQRRGSKVYRM